MKHKTTIIQYVMNYLNSSNRYVTFDELLTEVMTEYKLNTFTLNLIAGLLFNLLSDHNSNYIKRNLNKY